MKKLNNKGMTTVEILVSFILVALISASLYTTVSNYNLKRKNEADKLEINTFKNILTKTIQDDLIKKGLVSAYTKEIRIGEAQDEKPEDICTDVFIADFFFKDNKADTSKRIVIVRRLADDYFVEKVTHKYDDSFEVYYGTPTNKYSLTSGYDDVIKAGNKFKDYDNVYTKTAIGGLTAGLEMFPVPDLGYGLNAGIKDVSDGYMVKDFRILNVRMGTENNVFSLFIGFDYVNAGSKYAINIVCPLNYELYQN